MSRWYLDKNDKDIYLRDDKGIRWNYNQKEIVKILVGQDQRIAELEEQLRNAIVPKFNIGKEVWVVLDDGVAKDVVENNWFLCSLEKSRLGLYEDYLFATEEEAQAKLKELQEE